ncbi:MAG: ABC transporter ATP-binding protein [Actinobacteria bacterium]|nr:ABC transporter ATP-binding protein [Actinomycetota bacterium]
MLVAEDVRRSYGDHRVLDGLDLTVEAGEICGLLGPNGAGKTTFASIVAGLLRPDAGRVLVGGHDATADPMTVRRSLGYAPQQLGVYPLATVRENLGLFGELAGLRRRDLHARIEQVGGALGLLPLLDRIAGMLSGGEQRRLHTAMALLHRPALVLLDEPTVAADVQTRAMLLEFVRDLADEGTAVCYSTHYLPEIEVLDATVALLADGRIRAQGSVAELVNAHGATYIELRFDGPAPDQIGDHALTVDGDRVLVPSREPALDTARVVAALGADAPRLLGLEIVRPSLESVFIELTGRRPADDAPEVERVAG